MLSGQSAFGKKIKNGEIDKEQFEECHEYFDKVFENGIKTPISTVYDKQERFYHIVDRHEYMMSKGNIDRIVETLEKPVKIYKTTDKFGIQATCYLEDANKNPLLVIVRNGIITAYEPEENYLKNNIFKKGELIWESR